MPLVIHLRRNQTAIVNGAEIENVSGRTISIAVRNEATVLRSGDMLKPEDALTPATELYFALQGAYLSANLGPGDLAAMREQVSHCVAMGSGAAKITADIVRAIDGGNLYAALKCARALIREEAAGPWSNRPAAAR